MERYPYSAPTAAPLSAAAQRVMAALQTQYWSRIDRTRHMCSFSPEARLDQDQHAPVVPEGLYSRWYKAPPEIRLHMQDPRSPSAAGLITDYDVTQLSRDPADPPGTGFKGLGLPHAPGERTTRPPPLKRRCFGRLQTPVITHSEQFEENNSGYNTEEIRALIQQEENMPKKAVLEEQSQYPQYPRYLRSPSVTPNVSLSHTDHLHQISPKLIKLCEVNNPSVDLKEEIRAGQRDHSGHRAVTHTASSADLTAAPDEDSNTGREHCTPPNVTKTDLNPPVLPQMNQNNPRNAQEMKTIPPPKQAGLWEIPRSSLDTPKISLTQQHVPQSEKTQATGQLLNPGNSAQVQEQVPVQIPNPRGNRKLEYRVEMSDINEAEKLKHRPVLLQDGNKIGDKTSESAKLLLALTSDPRICDPSRLSEEEKACVLEEAVRARALVVTMVYQDGTTQLHPQQKCPPAVCGVLVLLKKSLDSVSLEGTGAAEERLLFVRLEQRPVWLQQDPPPKQQLFSREILLQMLCGTQTLVCYKAKDLLRTALRHFSKDLTWKQVAGCKVLDPQIAAWLLDPADSASCFQNLFNKYCTRPSTSTPPQNELRNNQVARVMRGLTHLHRVMVELRNRLQTQGLWKLYFCMEQKMIPILAAMESHRIHVDKDGLKNMSELLGTKVKQLEQEAHQAAGQQFLVSSSSQLRMVLFEKLRLQEKCENKNLPKTLLKQQQSTSEAALLQLQHLHPLPKIVLEYRQMFISSTWNQTSTVSGRLSSKHPNFQALPKQPVQISMKPNVQDFCQVELRLLAHLSSDPELLRIFQSPEADVFTMLASQWKGVSEDALSPEDREHAKRIVYSVVYGAGKERLSVILGVSPEEATRFQDTFLQTYRAVPSFIQRTLQYCHRHGYVKSIMGRRRSLPHVHSPDWSIRTQAERQAVNFVVQGSAADLCKMAMIQICSHVSSSTTLTARLVAQIHDELLFEVQDSQVEDFAVLVKKTMESLQHIESLGVSLAVPLKVSVCKGRSWGSMWDLNLPHAGPAHTSA